MTIEQTLRLMVEALEKAQGVLAYDCNYPKTAAALDAPIAAGRAALAQMAAPVAAAVPTNWPTNEMIEAGRKAAQSHGALLGNGQSLWHIFRAMLAAAPAAAVPEGMVLVPPSAMNWLASSYPPRAASQTWQEGWNACRDYVERMVRKHEAAAQAAKPDETCWCDEQGIGEPGVSCGDCPIRDYKPAAQAAKDAAVPDHAHMLQELLAVIHRDGGHYTVAHGIAKSVEDAKAVVWAAFDAAQAAEPEPAQRLTDKALFAAMTAVDPTWNEYGAPRGAAAKLARDVTESAVRAQIKEKTK